MHLSRRKLTLNSVIFIVFTVALLAPAVNATATSCGNNLTTSGDYELTGDTTAAGICLEILASNVKLDCDGYKITYGTGGLTNSYGIRLVSGTLAFDNVTIQDCTIEKTAAGGNSGIGILASVITNFTIYNNTINTNGGSTNYGIYYANTSNSTAYWNANISSNRITTNGTSSTNIGMFIRSNNNVSVANNNISTNGSGSSYGIEFLTTGISNITGNNITTGGTAASNYGIYLATTSNTNKITENYIATNGTSSNFGIYVAGGSTENISANTIRTGGSTSNNYGIYLSSAGSGSNITYNNITANGTTFNSGIYISTISSITILFNNVSTSGLDSYGIYLASGSTTIRLKNNTVYTSGGDAFYSNSVTLTDWRTWDIDTTNTAGPKALNITYYGGARDSPGCPNNTAVVNPNVYAIMMVACHNVTLDSFNASNAIYLVNTSYSKVNNSQSTDNIYGIVLISSSFNQISNNTISTNGTGTDYGIYTATAPSDNNNITGNIIFTNSTGNSNYGIYISVAGPNNVTYNNITTNGTSNNFGITISGANNNASFNNIFTGGSTTNNYGIYISTGNNSALYNNISTRGGTTGNAGIVLTGSISSNNVSFNSIKTQGSTTNYGVYISVSNFNNISSNNISTNGTSTANYGIYLTGAANYNKILSNNVTTTSDGANNYGINADGNTAHNTTIQANNISTNGTGGSIGIYMISGSNNITQNYITTNGISNSNYGMYLSNQTNNVSYNTIITDGTSLNNFGISLASEVASNVINNNITTKGTSANYGIYIASSKLCNISNNNITTKGTTQNNYGVYFISTSVNNTLYANTISTNGTYQDYGINIGSASSANNITSNTIMADGTAQANYGILNDGANNTFRSNNITTGGTTNNYGIFIANSKSVNFTGNKITTGGSSGGLNYGIRLSATSLNNFTDNNITTNGTSNTNYGLFTGNTSSNNNFTNTTMESNTSAPLYIYTTSNNNAFNHTTLRTLVDWINTDSGSSSNHFANTTFDIPANGSITIVPNVTAGASTNVSRANLYIAWNKSYLNSASLTFLNVSGQILLRNITFADPGSTVDYDDDGTFAQCATCTEVNFFQGVFTYNITSFTAYSSNEANLPPAVTIVTPANNSTATNSTPTVSVRIIDTIDSNVSVTIFANGSNKSYNGTVINGTETIMAWSSTADGIYYYYASARDPLGNVNVSDGNSTLIIDTTVPNITQTPNSDSSNNTTVNRTWQFFNFSIVDNTYLANTSFELTSAQNGSTVNYSLTKGGTSYNYTINLTNAVEGNYSYRVYANDSAGNQRRFINNWFFVDLEATTIENIFHKPNDTNDLDPNNTLVNVTADVIDSSQNISGGGIHSVVLEFSTNGTTIHNTTMLNVSGNTKWGNFTSNATGNWTYRIFANDTAGKSTVSANTTISVAYDYTWTLSPTNITTTSAAIGNNITMVNITLNNTGDYSQIFVIAKDIAVVPIVTLNQTTANLSQGRQTMIQVNVTPPTTAGTYDMSIKFTANNSTQSTATPQVNYSNGTFISRGDGPFLYLTIDSANASVARGDTYYINVKVVNYGNETANSAWVAYSVPSGWTATNDSLGSVGPNETTTWSNVTFAVPASADTGAQAILAYVGFQNYKHNQTSNASTSVSVTSSGTTTTTTTTSGGGGGAGGGGGGGSGGLSEAQKATLFGTPKVYDLVSGKDKVFPFVVGNPYAGSEMHNVSIEVTGLLSQYLRVEPKFVAKIPKDGSYPTKIIITAPAYFTEGEHELTFTIKSTVIKGVVRTKATETTKVVLRVHEISTDDAKELIGDTAGLIAKLQKAGFYSKGIEALLKKAQAGFESGDYKSVSELSKDAQQLVDNAFASDKGIKSLGPQVEGAGNLGARVSESARLLNLAKAAFARGDFNTAAERIKEAELTYLVETKGYFNFAYFIRSNFRNILLSTVAAILLSVGTYFYGTYAYLSHNLRGSQREEDILLGLMKTIQRECFEEKKMSMSEYGEAMFQYERKLNKVVQKIVELESKKANLLKFGHEDQQLKHEAARIMELIKETQKKYMEKGDLETRIYEDKMKGFTTRLGEVEERIASLEAIKAVRENKGVFGKLMIWLTKAVGEEEKE